MFEIGDKVWFLGAAVKSGDIVSINMLRNVAFVMVDGSDGWSKTELQKMVIYHDDKQALFDRKEDAYKAFYALANNPPKQERVKPTVHVSGVDMSYAIKEKKVSWISLT